MEWRNYEYLYYCLAEAVHIRHRCDVRGCLDGDNFQTPQAADPSAWRGGSEVIIAFDLSDMKMKLPRRWMASKEG